MRYNGAQILCETLLEQGVDTIFGYPGGAVLNIYDALYQYQDRIRHILTAHEQGAAHAADGYARATGKTGVVLATSGPGATNLVTGIATAYMDSIPMVAITGNVGVPLIGKDSFQEVYIAGITMPITKHNFVVGRVEELADIVREAFQIAQSGRQGPVLIDIPKDVTAAMCEFSAKPVSPITETYDVSDADFRRIAAEINAAKRPVIYYGGGMIASGACEELVALMHKADIPATGTVMSIGSVPSDDPLYLGMIGMHGKVSAGWAIDRSDLLLSIGTRFSDRVATNTNRFAPDARIIHVDVDAAEINKNMPADDFLVSDAKTFLSGILPYIQPTRHDAWRAQIEEWRVKLDYKPKDAEDCLHPHQIVQICTELGGDDLIFTTDVGQHQMWTAQYCARSHPRQFLTSGGLGTMGFGYGAAIGAKTAKPEQPVIHITGDGSFHMNLNELCTTVTYQIPVITVIMNNQVLGMVRQWQRMFYEDRFSSTTLERKTDYVKLAEAFGARGFRCTTPKELREALAKALVHNGPTIIDCVVDRDERVLPMIAAGEDIRNIIAD
ncbi:MAG: biosynthetic-type acetolactate synthase large subunit [Butyricicoccus pullicaecorum]|nr:biosynthetic-type acetolactate synthase large subunit [Butyricicoccus pullicaecorum]MDO4669219.1 biosynthetic-type acetolactate synthase large subunit [Butyricicoccus pullicaecorum]